SPAASAAHGGDAHAGSDHAPAAEPPVDLVPDAYLPDVGHADSGAALAADPLALASHADPAAKDTVDPAALTPAVAPAADLNPRLRNAAHEGAEEAASRARSSRAFHLGRSPLLTAQRVLWRVGVGGLLMLLVHSAVARARRRL